MTEPKFYNKDGSLTVYALGCGYIEKHETDSRIQTTLWAEHGVYHVRQHDFGKHERVFWNVFDTVGEARDCYYSAIA